MDLREEPAPANRFAVAELGSVGYVVEEQAIKIARERKLAEGTAQVDGGSLAIRVRRKKTKNPLQRSWRSAALLFQRLEAWTLHFFTRSWRSGRSSLTLPWVAATFTTFTFLMTCHFYKFIHVHSTFALDGGLTVSVSRLGTPVLPGFRQQARTPGSPNPKAFTWCECDGKSLSRTFSTSFLLSRWIDLRWMMYKASGLVHFSTSSYIICW